MRDKIRRKYHEAVDDLIYYKEKVLKLEAKIEVYEELLEEPVEEETHKETLEAPADTTTL